jgi:hypothetical protein
MLGARIVNNKTSFKVIEGIEYKIDVGEIVLNIRGIRIIDFGLDLHGRIDAAELRLGGDRLRDIASDVLFVEQGLALQIGKLNKISIDHSEKPEAGAHELIRNDRSQRAQTYEQRPRRCQTFLALFADWREPGLSRISVIEGQCFPSPA